MKRLMVKLKRYFKTNPEANSIDTKELNAEINIDGYVFCKRGNQQQLIKKYYVPRCGTQDVSHPYIAKASEPKAYIPKGTQDVNIPNVTQVHSLKPTIKDTDAVKLLSSASNHATEVEIVEKSYEPTETEINEIKTNINELRQYINVMNKRMNELCSIVESLQKSSYGNGYANLLAQFH